MGRWYERSFGEDYLLVYKHRTTQAATAEVRQMIAWLKLSEQDLILDLCCGMGRHTLALAQHRLKVVGFDLSKVLLSHAVAAAQGYAIPFVYGDMRSLPFVDHTYQVVLNLFTSFGYFTDDQDNFQVLREIARVLVPDGRFLVDFMNREKVSARLIPWNEREEQGVKIHEARRIEGDWVYKEIWVNDEKGERRYEERVKLYTYAQMEQMMAKAGLEIAEIYGNFQGEPYHAQSERMILVGRVQR
jgi:ubiquinone/menaquinone biosynthesis C-methylase UbiE